MATLHEETNATRIKRLRRPLRQRIVQNFLLAWLDESEALPKESCEPAVEQIRSVVNDVNLFTDLDSCFRFLEQVSTEKAFVIVSNSLGQALVPRIHGLSQIDAIYILCDPSTTYTSWTKEWSKIRGVHSKIKSICQSLKEAIHQCNQDSIPVSFVQLEGDAIEIDLDRLEPSFMYTQIFKKILLEMRHSDEARQTLVKYCQEKFADNPQELKIIEDFRLNYIPEKAVWWYTRECFTYQMLNRGLRLLEGDIIINMGFFIHDLHQQLEELHKAQISRYGGRPFSVFRGQGLSLEKFHRLQKTNQGGLMAFNSFLSTSTMRNTSLAFARTASKQIDMVGILFVMTIDPTSTATPFAAIDEISYFHEESEILFSMHTVFRIGQIKALDKHDQLFEIVLQITGEDDPQLRNLTTQIEDEVKSGTGWESIGSLLIRLGQLDKAEELYLTLIDRTTTEREIGSYYHQLGVIQDRQGNYAEAIEYYEKAILIRKKILPVNELFLAASYSGLGLVYFNIGDYSEALSFYEKALQIQQKILPADHLVLATSYNNIGGVHYKNSNDNAKALFPMSRKPDHFSR